MVDTGISGRFGGCGVLDWVLTGLEAVGSAS
jgi:hypothetical protein